MWLSGLARSLSGDADCGSGDYLTSVGLEVIDLIEIFRHCDLVVSAHHCYFIVESIGYDTPIAIVCCKCVHSDSLYRILGFIVFKGSHRYPLCAHIEGAESRPFP